MRPACPCLDAMPDSIAPNRCPLCGQANSCSQADPARADQSCWCLTAEVDSQALAQVPDALKDRTCLCPCCAQGLPPAREA